jgi:PhnB protein
MGVKPVPDGYTTVTPYLAVDDATGAIEWYERAFGAKERGRMPGPDGKIAHAEIEIGDSVIMLADPFPQSNVRPPKETGGTTAGIFLYVENVDDVFRRAVDAGANVTSEPEDMFWGDRFASVTDPYGHSWQIATHIEDLTPEEMQERSQEWMAAMASS